jgi:hypothetical protein
VTKKKHAQEYSDEEFQAVVQLIQGDEQLRADIEAITGQSLEGKSPRELFDLFRAINTATEIQLTVARYGQARRLVARTRAELEAPARVPETEAERTIANQRALIRQLEQNNEALRARNAALNNSNGIPAIPAPTSTARPLLQGEVAS